MFINKIITKADEHKWIDYRLLLYETRSIWDCQFVIQNEQYIHYLAQLRKIILTRQDSYLVLG